MYVFNEMSVSDMFMITIFDIFDILSLYLRLFLFIGKYDLVFQSLDAIFSLIPFSRKTKIDDQNMKFVKGNFIILFMLFDKPSKSCANFNVA